MKDLNDRSEAERILIQVFQLLWDNAARYQTSKLKLFIVLINECKKQINVIKHSTDDVRVRSLINYQLQHQKLSI